MIFFGTENKMNHYCIKGRIHLFWVFFLLVCYKPSEWEVLLFEHSIFTANCTFRAKTTFCSLHWLRQSFARILENSEQIYDWWNCCWFMTDQSVRQKLGEVEVFCVFGNNEYTHFMNMWSRRLDKYYNKNLIILTILIKTTNETNPYHTIDVCYSLFIFTLC